jgi:hypothetical protein
VRACLAGYLAQHGVGISLGDNLEMITAGHVGQVVPDNELVPSALGRKSPSHLSANLGDQAAKNQDLARRLVGCVARVNHQQVTVTDGATNEGENLVVAQVAPAILGNSALGQQLP